MFKHLSYVALAGACAAATPALAAGTVTFALTAPVQTVAASGGRVDYYATVSAAAGNGGEVWLNGDMYNINPGNDFVIDDSAFFANFPYFLDPGQSFTGLLFTLTVPATAIAQTYTGSIGLLGGASFESDDTIATATFQVDVAAAAAVPEAATWATMMLGLGAVGDALRRRRATVAVAA